MSIANSGSRKSQNNSPKKGPNNMRANCIQKRKFNYLLEKRNHGARFLKRIFERTETSYLKEAVFRTTDRGDVPKN